MALHKLITENIKLYDKYNNQGTLIYKDNLYIFVSDNLKNKLFTYNNLKSKKNTRFNKLNISQTKIINQFNNSNNNHLFNNLNTNLNNRNGNNNNIQNNISNNQTKPTSKKVFKHIDKKIIEIKQLSVLRSKNINEIINDINFSKKKYICIEKINLFTNVIFKNNSLLLMDFITPKQKKELIEFLIKNFKKNKDLSDQNKSLLD